MSQLEMFGKLRGTDKVEHGYLPYYERHFSHSGHPLVEIGIHKGQSCDMWVDWFGNSRQVIGVENSPDFEETYSGRYQVIMADATTPAFFDQVSFPLGIVIDDGSHKASDIMATLNGLWPHVASGGWYVIEDLGAQFWDRWEGSPVGSTVTDFLRNCLLDVIRSAIDIEEFHLYQEIVFLRKR